MSLELLLIICVALLVFDPKKLPMLAKHIGMLRKTLQHYHQKWQALQEQVAREATLHIREEQAREADKHYHKATKPNTPEHTV